MLAGGAARRLGGVSKAEVEVAGRALLDHVLDAAAGAREVVVVGPDELARPGVRTTLEHPPSGGPVAGIDAGLALLDAASRLDGSDSPSDAPADVVLVLACDVPRADAAVPGLFAALAAAPQADGAHVVDDDGHPQLVALYRRGPLQRALAGLLDAGGVHGVSVRRLAAELTMVEVPDPGGAAADADTWDDVARLDSLISRREHVVDQTAQPTGGSELHRWLVAVGEELDVDPDAVDVDVLLDLARDVAHQVARPAVPLTSFLVGYAVAASGGDRSALEQVVQHVTELANRWGSDADGSVTEEGH